MTTLMLWVAMLAGGLAIVAGIAGSRPRPSDGRWVAMSPSLRAGLSMIGLVAILVGWALIQGWFKLSPSVPVPRPYSEARGDRPPDTLWNEAEVAQREARIRAQTSAGPVPVESLPAPVAAPAAAVEPASVLVPESATLPLAAEAAAPPSAAPAPVATPQKTPPKKKVAARSSKEPDCDCDPAAPATKPSRTRSRNVGAWAASRSDTVSVCALQRQYGIVDGR